MTAPKMTWTWHPGGERYEGPDAGDTVEAAWWSYEQIPRVWIRNAEDAEASVQAETVAPAAVVLAAMVRAFGRAEVVEWARTVQLDPGDQPQLFGAEVEP